MWYGGGWYPDCNLQLRAMQQSMDKIENIGAKLVVLTPELPEKAKETAEANDLDIVALHDKGSAVAQEQGLVFQLPEAIIPVYRDKLKLPEYNGNDVMELPLSATHVIDKSGKITYAFLDADYKKRDEPADVIKAVKAAARYSQRRPTREVHYAELRGSFATCRRFFASTLDCHAPILTTK